MKTKFKFLIPLFAVLILLGCAKQNDEVKQPEESTAHMSGMMVHNAWIRQAAEGTTTALFGMIMNHTEVNDTLIGVSSDLAQLTEFHETYQKEDDMMGMRHIEAQPIDANSSLILKPGSYHVMLIRLNQDLNVGNTKEITFHFKHAGDIKVEAIVKEMNEMGSMDHSQH
ncbi:MAG: copper chaperone PCu(A)C [Bacteroidetes bacterium]|nr:copper chaperone PCu(A)C [Bacteroidota bacterium]